MMLITMQAPLFVPSIISDNIDYTFIFRENNVNQRKILYEKYASIFPSFQLFCEVLDHYTENHTCVVIDNTSQSNKLEDRVFWYKASYDKYFSEHAKYFQEHVYYELITKAMHPSRILQCIDSDF